MLFVTSLSALEAQPFRGALHGPREKVLRDAAPILLVIRMTGHMPIVPRTEAERKPTSLGGTC